MKSKIIEDRYLLECDCGFPSHLLVFDVYDDEEYSDIFVSIVSNWRKPFWCRVIQAFKYIIGKEDYLNTDGIIFSERNIEDLEEVIKKIKETKESKK